MNSHFDIFCSASAAASRFPIVSRAYSPCGSVYYHILFVLALVLAAAYLYLVRLVLQPPTPDTLSSESPRAAPGRSAAVAPTSPSNTLPSEQVAKNASAGDKDAPPPQHGSLERLGPTKTVPKGRNTPAHAAGPDAHTARSPNRSPSTPAPSTSPLPPSPDVTQGNAKPAIQRGASLPTSGLEPSRDYVPTLAPRPSTNKSSPLNQVLYVGSKDIAKITSLDILVFPYGHQGTISAIRDPRIDAKYQCEQFAKLKGVTVQSIPNDEVTLDRVKEAITARWEAAQPGTCLLVLLTGDGDGDGDNAMQMNSKSPA
ncbi:hypothetical protein FRC06_010498 [Ceratobasidium sp. 370]|nr:hypothetical protein FRC06_010498 [Ceratobasidium sp. 370]